MEVVLDDIGADCDQDRHADGAAALDAWSRSSPTRAAGVPLVVDPVLAAKGDARCCSTKRRSTHWKSRLIPRAAVLTPNLPEAETLTGMTCATSSDMKRAAEMLATLGSRCVLLKGGHMSGAMVRDVFFGEEGMAVREPAHRDQAYARHRLHAGLGHRRRPRPGHGAGSRRCGARELYLTEAIRGAPGLGAGHGPLDHGHTLFKATT